MITIPTTSKAKIDKTQAKKFVGPDVGAPGPDVGAPGIPSLQTSLQQQACLISNSNTEYGPPLDVNPGFLV